MTKQNLTKHALSLIALFIAPPAAYFFGWSRFGAAMLGVGLAWMTSLISRNTVLAAPAQPDSLHARAQALWATPEDTLIANHKNIPITGKSIRTVMPNCWVNDEIINSYLNLLPEQTKLGQKLSKLNSAFYTMLENQGVQSRRRASRKQIDSFRNTLVLMPLHLKDSHWALGVIDLRNKEIRYMDSLGYHREGEQFFANMRAFLQAEQPHRPELRTLNLNDWKNVRVAVPTQNNGVDCGVFTMMYARHISEGKALNFTQQDIPAMREQITVECAQHRLIP